VQFKKYNSDGTYQNEWKADGKAIEFSTSQDSTEFVRVLNVGKDSITEPAGNWVLRMQDIEGLTPAQIRQKYALPQEPTHFVPVTLPGGVNMRSGASASNDFGAGGGYQYNIRQNGRLPEEWFGNLVRIGK